MPVVVYVFAVAILHARPLRSSSLAPVAMTGALLLTAAVAARWTDVPLAVLVMGLLISGLVATRVVAAPHLSAATSNALSGRAGPSS